MNKIDTLFINGNVLTFDEMDNQAKSVAIAGDTIVGIWTESDPRNGNNEIPNNCKVIDLEGKTLIPGFIDTHNHILMHAQNLKKVNCSTPPNKSIEDILELIKEQTEKVNDGSWIEGYGYDDTLLKEMRHPTKKDLDRVAPKHPVLIKHISGHLAVANSLALEIAGIDEDVKDTMGGQFGRDEEGRLNGVLYEKEATEPIESQIPVPSEEEMLSMYRDAVQEYVQQGITTNTDAAVGINQGEQELHFHYKAAQTKVNPMRSQLMIMHNLLREDGIFAGYTAEELDRELREKSDNLVSLDSAKMFQDGSIQGLTAALREPYHNAPDVYGEIFHKQQDFNEEIKDLHDRGFRLAIHGNGDRAIGSIISAYEYALSYSPKENHLHRIEHVQTATKEDLDKMQELGIAGSIFINHIYYWGDRHKKIFLGEERASKMNGLADILEREILFTLHSDCPITPISPLFSIWCAVNRITRDGEVLGADQKIDVNAAFKSMTIWGAELINKADDLGSIEIGKKADFAILNQNPFLIDSVELKNIQVLSTFIGGKEVYSK